MDLDLLGDPVRYDVPRRGRPSHVVTAENRRIIKELLIAGEPVEAVARAVGVTEPTLRSHYRRILFRYGRRRPPRYMPTEERRVLVKALRQRGEPQAAIARALGISVSTLRRHHMGDLKEDRDVA